MSDTSGLPNTDSEGIPAEDRPERFGDAQASEPAENDPGQSSGGGEDGPSSGGGEDATRSTPDGAEDVTDAQTAGSEAAEPPPADFDPAQQPSNPDLVKNTEPPD